MSSSSSSSPEILAASTASQDRFSYKHATHDEVLEDLSSRFILNLPDEELASLERICFQVEQAHWFYEDFIREENPKFPSLPLKKFSAMLFDTCPLLRHWSDSHEQAFNNFMQYKTRVPVCGAIMLNESWDKCILVKGWKASSGWGFPKGKINQDEPEHLCAIREVLEETGYNLAGQIQPDDVIEMSIREQKISLFIVPNVPEDFEFEPKTRKEISRIAWFKLTDLPTWKRNTAAAGRFYLISPFIGALKTFINARKPRGIERRPPNVSSTHTSQPQSRPDNSGRTVSSYPSYVDSSPQESSSPSSSADNGDPHTPSPKYDAPHSHVTTVSVDENLDIQTFDPHFAHLLSSLSMSANNISDASKKAAPMVTMNSSSRAAGTPVPATTSFAKPDNLERSDDQSHTRIRPSDSRPPQTSSPFPPVHPPSSVEVPFPSAASKYRAQSPPLITKPFTTAQLLPPVSTIPKFPTASSLSSRRTSSTADISPYLSRLSEVPTSSKRLKQLALLERVADESARMAPMPGNSELSIYGSAKPFHAPPPPHITSSEMKDQSIIYSSKPGEVLGQMDPPLPAHQFYSRPLPNIPQSRQDPAIVRPSTSQALGRDLAIPAPLANPNLQSAHQSQLLSTINGLALHRSPVQQAFTANLRPPRGVERLNIPPYQPSLFEPTMSAPATSIAFNLSAPTNESQNAGSLLSILNSGRECAAGGSTLNVRY